MAKPETNHTFEKSLTDELMRNLNLLRYAFGGGIVLFGAIVLVMNVMLDAPSGNDETFDASFITILSIGHGFAFAIGWLIAPHIERGHLGVGRFKKMKPHEEIGIDEWQKQIRASWVTGLTIREGVAFFGLVICMVGIFLGIMPGNSLYWLNFMSPLLFVYYAFFEAPTKDRFMALYYSEDDGIL